MGLTRANGQSRPLYCDSHLETQNGSVILPFPPFPISGLVAADENQVVSWPNKVYLLLYPLQRPRNLSAVDMKQDN